MLFHRLATITLYRTKICPNISKSRSFRRIAGYGHNRQERRQISRTFADRVDFCADRWLVKHDSYIYYDIWKAAIAKGKGENSMQVSALESFMVKK